MVQPAGRSDPPRFRLREDAEMEQEKQQTAARPVLSGGNGSKAGSDQFITGRDIVGPVAGQGDSGCSAYAGAEGCRSDPDENGGVPDQGRVDLHTHSICSDGDRTPAALVRCAADAGITLLALTDHDCMRGVPEAIDAGRKCGVSVVPGVEMDNEYDQELHILGLCVDIENAALRAALEAADARRTVRNARILQQLAETGIDLEPHLKPTEGMETRLHIALALVQGGFAESVPDAFARYLRRGTPGYATVERPAPAQVIALLRGAGGIPVLAHPCHLKGNVHAIVQELCALGLGGIEAYYPTSTAGQTRLFLSLAAQHGLLITCGSDFHGDHRPAARLGCAWTPDPALEQTRRLLLGRL